MQLERVRGLALFVSCASLDIPPRPHFTHPSILSRVSSHEHELHGIRSHCYGPLRPLSPSLHTLNNVHSTQVFSHRFTPLGDLNSDPLVPITLYQDVHDQGCYPFGPNGSFNALLCANDFGLTYGPGICPSGYTTYAKAISTVVAMDFETLTDPVYTLATCCLEYVSNFFPYVLSHHYARQSPLTH